MLAILLATTAGCSHYIPPPHYCCSTDKTRPTTTATTTTTTRTTPATPNSQLATHNYQLRNTTLVLVVQLVEEVSGSSGGVAG